ncbi:ATP-binding protein [Sphingomonas lenta]|uniref:ATP-binding protein n=2 Tax=Sphingomonas lenta TaxID=1141887 RepID=A0A2A2SKG7_9SPHN|nr:ATP-binding protein [Sphingomonas lenta]
MTVFRYLWDCDADKRARAIGQLGQEERDAVERYWPEWAHDGQRPPPGDWRTWVLMAGRGFGKTLAGANWVLEAAKADGSLRIALVAATLDEARRVMVDGRSGLLSVADRWIEEWSPSRDLIRFVGGAEATLFSGANPDRLRGPEHHIAWCDELAKWEKPLDTWNNLQLGLRLGRHPRALVTTTPRPGPALRRIMAEPGCVATGGRTTDNPHTSAAYKETVQQLFAGTRLGAQELDGLLLPDGGALWTPETLEKCRRWSGASLPPFASSAVEKPSTSGTSRFLDCARNEREGGGRDEREGAAFTRTLIGVDPPSGDGTCGIVACALDEDRAGHVLADHSVTGRSPEGWARAVADAAAVHGTREVVAERNQGGQMVASVLRAADTGLHVRLVHASDGKTTRADPVALLFEAGRVTLHGRLPDLEAELLGLVAGAPYQGPGPSPDRADAMVWALTELMLKRQARVGVHIF